MVNYWVNGIQLLGLWSRNTTAAAGIQDYISTLTHLQATPYKKRLESTYKGLYQWTRPRNYYCHNVYRWVIIQPSIYAKTVSRIRTIMCVRLFVCLTVCLRVCLC